MSFKEILLTVLSAVIMNNLVFTQFLGIGSMSDKKTEKYLGSAVTVVMLITAAIFAPVSALLAEAGLGAFNTFAAVIIILAVCTLLELICGKTLKLSFPLLALNSAVLGLVLNNAGASMDFLSSVLTALGAGLGFWLALILMSSLQIKLNNPEVPRAFRGFPIKLLAAGIISMAIMAF